MAYEKKAMRELKERLKVPLNYHTWLRFTDANGTGHCEPEAFIELRDEIILFEMKLTGGHYGRLQMEGLYKPLLEFIYKKPVRCLMVCRNVTPATPRPLVHSPEEFMLGNLPFAVWQWLG